MILPVIVVTMAATVASQTHIKTSANVSSLAASTLLEDYDVDDDDNRISVSDIDEEHLCTREIVFNFTQLISYRAYTRKKCQNSTKNCNKDGHEWVTSVRYRNLTKTRLELICCEGYMNDSGKCVKDLSDSTVNKTSDLTQSEMMENTSLLLIAIPVAGAVFLVVFIAVICKIKRGKKRPRERSSFAHENPIYDSNLGQSVVIVDNTCSNDVQSNHNEITDTNTK
ncbi:uncharacterized protein LOC132545400 [Ylistrum balloti]|uniref:uncharacterized protein LOC132545400 n=1 Tax=Ylistrum balloti TaxID=509963 RepID=UPI00290582FC|nr:uncharacterized protein LOC132545400 [Ylistrum balloti]